jgi:serine/threonine protein kinase
MDLFFTLTEDIRRNLFHISSEIEEQMRNMIHVENERDHTIRQRGYAQVAEMAQRQLPKSIIYETIVNPFKRWRRLKHGNRYRNLFQWGNWHRSIPSGMIKDNYKSITTAYVVHGYSEIGSYAKVHTFVVFKEKNCVLKMMEEDDADFFELVTQVYLSQKCKELYSHICVPDIYFIQRGKNRHNTDVCMARGNGAFLKDLQGKNVLIALAYVLRSLWFLQKDFFFMHRDLSGKNVMFDFETFKTTFIDFGMSCINPSKIDVSWQHYDETFFIPMENSHATKCTNRSHDVCTLIAYLAPQHPFLQLEHNNMKREMRSVINKSPNERAKSPLLSPRKSSTQFTTIKPGWTVGNELNTKKKEPDGHHWWLFNMVEFPMDKWYPENMMTRILEEIPLKHWFGIRRRWPQFDACMPNMTVYLRDGRQGILQKLVRNKLRVLIGTETVDILPNECSTYDL